jgi:hypothetical protein
MAKRRHPLPPAQALVETTHQDKVARGAFRSCAGCGVLVLTHTWHHTRGWVALEAPTSPIVGAIHECHKQQHHQGDSARWD